MPSNSKRKTAMTNMVTVLKTIVAGSTYFRTLNIGDNVSTKLRLMQTSREGASFIWVHPGNEDIRPVDLGATSQEATFEVLLDIAVKDATAATMVEELEDLIHDISLCLGSNPTLNGAVQYAMVAKVDPPSYGIEEMFAMTTVHVVCVYDFEYGSSV